MHVGSEICTSVPIHRRIIVAQTVVIADYDRKESEHSALGYCARSFVSINVDLCPLPKKYTTGMFP